MLETFRLGFFTKFISVFLSLFLLHVSFAAEKNSKDLASLEEKIGQAKILYYDFQFKKSEQLLDEVIESLKTMPSSSAVNHDLSEAYLRLALTQDAQSQSKQMQESLYQCVAYEASRELEPSQFAPTIIAQFNKAKQKFLLAQNQSSATSKLVLQSSDVKQKNESQPFGQKSEKKKSFFKTWPFFLIIGLVVAGGAAGAAIALGGGGGGGAPGPVTVGGTPQ